MKKIFPLLLVSTILLFTQSMIARSESPNNIFQSLEAEESASATIEKDGSNSSIITEYDNQELRELSRTLFLPKRSGNNFYSPSPAILTAKYLQYRMDYILTLAASRKEHILAWDNLIWRGKVSKSDISIIEKIYKFLLQYSNEFLVTSNSHNQLMTKKLGICGFYLLTKNELNGRYFNIPDQEYLDFYNLIEKMTYNKFTALLNESSADMFLYQKLMFSFESIARESVRMGNKELIGSAYSACEVIL